MQIAYMATAACFVVCNYIVKKHQHSEDTTCEITLVGADQCHCIDQIENGNCIHPKESIVDFVEADEGCVEADVDRCQLVSGQVTLLRQEVISLEHTRNTRESLSVG